MLDRATELTPVGRPDDELRRAVDAAYLHFESGDSRRAESQLEDVVRRLAPGHARAKALARLARVRSYDAQSEAVALFLQAVDEAGDDREILAVAHEGVAACLFRLRERLAEAVEHAELAARYALELGDAALAAESLGTLLLSETLLGSETATETAARALELQEASTERRVLAQPLFAMAVHRWWTDSVELARTTLVDMVRTAGQIGDESSLPYVLVLLGRVECLLGELESALGRAREGRQAAEQSGQHTLVAYNLALEGFVRAQLGDVEGGRKTALEALERVPATGGRPAELVAREALGHLELTLGSPDAVTQHLAAGVAFARQEGIAEPAAVRFVPDQVEALIEVGRTDEAIELLSWYEANARRLERASALASCARCRGLLAAQAGELDAALAAYAEALEWHGRVDVPLDRGRTLLALGVIQRRMKRRREARETLDEALATFEHIGAELWAGRARGELCRISGRAPAAGALTPAEERVASLVAEGKTNREVAAALFLSERTVEGHLSHVYGKLRVRSRTELARVLASGKTHEVELSNTGDSPVSPAAPAP
jgi:DNA-binding CsgD family transcriptional regulator